MLESHWKGVFLFVGDSKKPIGKIGRAPFYRALTWKEIWTAHILEYGDWKHLGYYESRIDAQAAVEIHAINL